MRAWLAIVLVVGWCSFARADGDTEARWQLGSERPHAGMPFTLILGVAGFDETPAPALPKLDLPGATVTPLGAKAQLQTARMNVNGQVKDYRQATWFLSYRVVTPNAGTLRLPATTVSQGKKTATAEAAEVPVDEVTTTDAMKLEMQLPARAVFVGETVEANLIWSFRAKPRGQAFTLPIANLDQFTVSAPPATDKEQTVEIEVGAKTLAVPYDASAFDEAGQHWTRVTIHLFIAPRASGKVAIPPATVVAALPVGQADFFGRADTREFRASDTAKSLEVKPLPETDRPPSYAGAVGGQFSIKVETSRSVVQIGEPVDLNITVKSDQRLDTLSLGKLDGEGQLPKDKFTVPGDPPTGELSADGKTKTFKVTALVTGTATEIPAIAFAYFDPAKIQYQTIHSDPIALSVKGGSVVGASDVVAIAPKSKAGAAANDTDLQLVVAELALSSPSDVSSKPLAGAMLIGLLAFLYLGSLGVFALLTWKNRTQEQREEAAEVRAARKRVETELARADKDAARDTAGALASAFRAYARTAERTLDDDGLLARIETESFSPTAKDQPLADDLRQRARALLARWIKEARRTPAKGKAVAAALLLVAIGLAPASARAQADAAPAIHAAQTAPTSSGDALATGRDAYQQALGVSDASARKAAFTRAAASLGEAAQVSPDEPELLADWGNAALGAGDVATATLAYRRALAIDPSNPRARKNLGWLRSRQGDNLRPSAGGAADTLFFFHEWPRGRQLLVGALAFALAMLLVVPWAGRRRRGLAMLAIIPAAVWLAMTVSVLFEDRHVNDAVVMDAVVLRAADSSGAPAALTQPLPRGTEVVITEKRDTWAKVRIAGGIVGWVPTGAVQRIANQ
jgi:tetratricopeptide (TPR) repeat protein